MNPNPRGNNGSIIPIYSFLHGSSRHILCTQFIIFLFEDVDFLGVLPHYDRSLQSPIEVIQDDSLGSALMLVLAERRSLAHTNTHALNHDNKS